MARRRPWREPACSGDAPPLNGDVAAGRWHVRSLVVRAVARCTRPLALLYLHARVFKCKSWSLEIAVYMVHSTVKPRGDVRGARNNTYNRDVSLCTHSLADENKRVRERRSTRHMRMRV